MTAAIGATNGVAALVFAVAMTAAFAALAAVRRNIAPARNA